MSSEDILKYLDNLHSKIVRSSFAENVTENEIMALVECKKLLKPRKPHPYMDFNGIERSGCPKCFEKNGRDEILYARQKFCSVCGQLLDWSDVN